MDLTLCKNDKCKLKDTCLRFKGVSHKEFQSYFMGSPEVNGVCEFYYPIKDKLDLRGIKEIDKLC